jgi:para-nitrobenzyl esterase
MIEYLGIPYAKPPVGELRFRRARKVEPWTEIFDAKAYGNPPVQFNDGKSMGDEDCLTVNVQRPKEGSHFPVFIYIYGGGYNIGSSSDDMYNGSAFVADGILFFSFNYRLNVLGFYDFTTYPGGERFDSNCGVSDQLCALEWIHDNISAFGGDLSRVTICGESAGGASVINMLAAPRAKGLFTQAIVESGLPNCIMSHEMARENIDLYLEGMGMTEDDVPKLLTMDPYAMLPGNEYMAKKHQYKNPGIFLPGPIQDDLLPVRPIDAIRGGSAAGVKLIIGTNLHEGTTFVHEENTGFPNSWDMVEEMFQKNGYGDRYPAVRSFYEAASKWEDPFMQFATDYAFEMPALKVAAGQKHYTDDVWVYRYELVTKSGEASGMKASHAFELPAVFVKRNHVFGQFVFGDEPDEVFEHIKHDIHDAWVAFIKEGDPGALWSRYTDHNGKTRIFDRESTTAPILRQNLMDLWDDMRFYEK